jgi:NADPH-dependent 2,4-dienoyl-CoA reductase/sulfur reductase-like enzyme
MGGIVSGLHEHNGVRLVCGVAVDGFVGRERVEAVELTNGTSLPADTVVVGIGALPNVEWLAGSGLVLANGVECDHQGRTGVPGIVAVGDCASWHDVRRGRSHRVEHWTGALERPLTAVTSLLSGTSDATASKPTNVPYFRSDQYDVRIQFAGHSSDADSVSVEEGSAANRDVLAVYRRGDEPVAVPGMNQARAFNRWRRQLNAASCWSERTR